MNLAMDAEEAAQAPSVDAEPRTSRPNCERVFRYPKCCMKTDPSSGRLYSFVPSTLCLRRKKRSCSLWQRMLASSYLLRFAMSASCIFIADDERSHVPTADRVARVFSGTAEQDDFEETPEAGEEERLEEIDFAEIARLQVEVDAAAAAQLETETREDVAVVEERFTGFYIDTKPSAVSNEIARPSPTVETALGDVEEEIIVYVAPHPRAGPVTPPPPEQIAEATQPQPYTSIFTHVQSSITQADKGGA